MATLQRFKLLATQCATPASGSTISPSASPSPSKTPTSSSSLSSFRIRRYCNRKRRKTLRTLLSRASPCRNDLSEVPLSRSDPTNGVPDRREDTEFIRHCHTSLKDLFVSPSSPSSPSGEGGGTGGGGRLGFGWRLGLDAVRRGNGGSRWRSTTGTSLRYRLLRRSWRPVLVMIPE